MAEPMASRWGGSRGMIDVVGFVFFYALAKVCKLMLIHAAYGIKINKGWNFGVKNGVFGVVWNLDFYLFLSI